MLPRLLALFTALLLALLAPAGQAQVLQFREALAGVGEGRSFPGQAGVGVVALPDAWERSRPGHSGSVWYRMAFDLPTTHDGLLGLYIERACSNVEVWLNGRLVHSAGHMGSPPSRLCQQPRLVSLPTGLMVPQGNLLDLRVAGHALEEVASRQRGGGLSTLELGPHATMAERHALRHLLAVTLPQVASSVLWLLGGLMLLLGLRNRNQAPMVFFGLMALGWGLVMARLWWANPPWPHHVVEWGVVTLLAAVTWVGVQYLLRYGGLRWRWLDWALPLQAVAVALALGLAGPQRVFVVASTVYALLGLEVVAAVAVYLRAVWHQPRTRFVAMGLLSGLVLLSLAAELGRQQHWLGRDWADLSHVLLPLAMLGQGVVLLLQYGRALQDSEHNRAELEGRIREATAQVERNYAQLSELRVEQVTERERKRIAADLHDDLGAKLLTIVHTSDSERISTLAREALEEMRLSVRGLTGKPVRLLDALGDWRAEVVSRLAQAGMEGEWQAPADEVPQTLSARAFVQTTRILREAVSNIIKHSNASRCSVRCAIADGDFQLIIQDNGNGIPMELDGRLDRGHGMSTMKHRAKQMQGQCLVESGPGYGTVIRLTLPLEQHMAQA
jgi:signal transduction histidine kinase